MCQGYVKIFLNHKKTCKTTPCQMNSLCLEIKAFDAVESHDGGIYKSKRWLPEYDFTLHQGECFVFPPGYFHETFVRCTGPFIYFVSIWSTFAIRGVCPCKQETVKKLIGIHDMIRLCGC